MRPTHSVQAADRPTAQESWGFQNVTTAVAKFNTGGLRHEAVAGFDVFYQEDERLGKSYTNPKTPGTLLNPNNSSANYQIVPNPFNQKAGDATNYAFFVSDRVWLTPQFSILAGTRWDNYEANYTYTQTSATIPAAGPMRGTGARCLVL